MGMPADILPWCFRAIDALSANLEPSRTPDSPDFHTDSIESYSSTCQAQTDLARKPKMFHCSATGMS